MTQNLRILVRNIADSATLIESPALLASLPGTNLQRMTERERTARTTGLSSQSLILQWDADQAANCLALTRHNLSTSATLRRRTAPSGSPTSYNDDGTALSAFSTSGLDTDIDVYTEADFACLRNSVQYFSLRTDIRELLLDIADASNPDGYMEAHRLWFGKYKTVTYDPPFGGAELQFVDGSTQERADDMTMLIDKRPKYRKLSINLQFITDSDDLAWLLAAARYLGKDKECFVSLYPGEGGVKEMYNQMACRLVDSPTFNPWQVGLHKNSMTFEET